MKKQALFAAACALVFLINTAGAEDINENFKKVNEYIAAENFPKALEELSWARKEIESMHTKKLNSFFPDKLGEFVGQPIKAQSAMGFTSVERKYKKGNESLNLTLTGGSGQAAGGMGGFAAMGRMAAMMGGGAPGQETFRLKGRTAMLETKNNRANLTIFLDSGSMLKLEQRNSADANALRTLAEQLPLDQIDAYLKGGK